ncbi:ABC transporter ATP-binding protein [Fontivita pretiosa]|jgi:ABC-2 type transport system ATP-binding protein|uniref:ABC transporter ATP-binding protein n=1 Tax=Fontivita pretiosa TaxID=2989684 RepID=UPI003D1770D7
MIAVEIDNVTKTFGRHVAVADLSLRVPQGSVYGFIGPNGSGKTTTLRMIMRILHPDRGHIRVLGEEKYGAANDRVGYLPEERGLYKQMRVRDLLRFYAQLKGHRPGRQEIDGWLARLFPDQDPLRVGGLKIEALSKGMSQKVQFIATVIARPLLVLLDEPFSGLDPVNADVLRELVLELRRNGTTVIFSTHDMTVAEQLCDAIFMIYRGRKVLDGTLREIQQEHGRDVIRVRLDCTARPMPRLDDLPGVVGVTDFGNYQELRTAADADTQQILAALMSRGRVEHFEIAHPSLQDIFRRIAQPGVDEQGPKPAPDQRSDDTLAPSPVRHFSVSSGPEVP